MDKSKSGDDKSHVAGKGSDQRPATGKGSGAPGTPVGAGGTTGKK